MGFVSVGVSYEASLRPRPRRGGGGRQIGRVAAPRQDVTGRSTRPSLGAGSVQVRVDLPPSHRPRDRGWDRRLRRGRKGRGVSQKSRVRPRGPCYPSVPRVQSAFPVAWSASWPSCGLWGRGSGGTGSREGGRLLRLCLAVDGVGSQGPHRRLGSGAPRGPAGLHSDPTGAGEGPSRPGSGRAGTARGDSTSRGRPRSRGPPRRPPGSGRAHRPRLGGGVDVDVLPRRHLRRPPPAVP